MAIITAMLRTIPSATRFIPIYRSENIEHIKNAGINVVSLANDHIADLGIEAWQRHLRPWNRLK